MLNLTGARLASFNAGSIDIALDRGFQLSLLPLDSYLARILIARPSGLRVNRTWSISPELAGALGDEAEADPIGGRDRLALNGFPGVNFEVSETDAAITVETPLFSVEVQRSPLALVWRFRPHIAAPFATVFEDRPTQAYRFDALGFGFAHYLKRELSDHYYGFGEKSGGANKHGRRLRMGMTDALGYDAETSDPLYKHIPFYITVRPDRGGEAVGLFYDDLARATFDLGQEIDAYHGPYRSFEAEDGDLDYYVIFGPSAKEVVQRFTALTGRTAFPPRWTLSYSGSAMQYTDAPDATNRLQEFLELVSRHDIPCRSFHLSSGYTLARGKRYVFAWDRDRFPDPNSLSREFLSAGMRLIANVKPAMLTDHPQFAEVGSFNGFIRDREDPSGPHIAQFWGGEAAFLDFTNPDTSAWWSRQVTEKLLDNGIEATWNDNNEFGTGDDKAGVDLCGEGGTISCLKPVQSALMMRASWLAQTAHAPKKRPFLVSRSGGPGMQRYAQTWTGDNRSEWKTLRYNLRMGHGLSLSGIYNFGHDVGGFAGPTPDPELFMRWIEQGIYWPRFTIHSWNDDGSANEPWMYPELLPLIRKAMHWRERLIPLLYTLLWRAHVYHEPILRPLFVEFPDQPQSYVEEDCFMLGPSLLVAPVLDRGMTARAVWLPDVEGGWYDVRSGKRLEGGRPHEAEAPFGAAPLFIRAGSILPLGPARSWEEGPLTLRLFPIMGAGQSLELYDDDGENAIDRNSPPCLIHMKAAWPQAGVRLELSRTWPRQPRWPEIRFEDEAGRPISVCVNAGEHAPAMRTSELPLR